MKSTTLMLITILLAVTAALSVQAQTYSVLYNFGSKSEDPIQPTFSGIIAQGRDGNLYSTAPVGGANGAGAVFKITPTGALTVLYSFTGGTDEGIPYSGLTLGTDGNFYGTTGGYNAGNVFKITPGGTLTVLHSFTGSDGKIPTAPPVQGTDGKLYGTTTGSVGGFGTIYKITPPSTFTLLHQFDGTDGAGPMGPLVQGTDGNFYGMTFDGGTSGEGVVFKITPTGIFKVIYNFDTTHGAYPYGPLVQGSDGSFYGTTLSGGVGGNVFKITATGTFTDLYKINGYSDGLFPYAGLVQATDGNFYGVTAAAGTYHEGTIFRFIPPPSDIYSVLHNFNISTTDTAANVKPTLLQHTNGILYGDTEFGGTGNLSPCYVGSCGIFYSLNANLPAFVSLLPYSGKVGQTIEFLGQHFTTSSIVSFNGTKSPTVTVPPQYPGTYLTAVVPNGATTGFVMVTTSSGTLKSNKIFRVVPQITSFSPTSGAPGTSVVINGESLKGATSVTFGGVKATFTVNSYTEITATVPSGAKTGTITVTTPGGTATSSGTFTVT